MSAPNSIPVEKLVRLIGTPGCPVLLDVRTDEDFAADPGPNDVFSHITVFFSKMAMVTFGGAYAVLAYVAQQAVEHLGWLRPPAKGSTAVDGCARRAATRRTGPGNGPPRSSGSGRPPGGRSGAPCPTGLGPWPASRRMRPRASPSRTSR